MTLGVDVGGTFTDLVRWDGRRLRTGKVSSTPDQSDGVLAGAAELVAEGSTVRLLHGTTVATNTLLERDGARTVLVTDEGMGDVLAIGRQERPSLYDVAVTRTAPVVPTDRRVEIAGRSDATNPRLPSEDELEEVFELVRSLEPEAIAVCTLYSFLDSAREMRVAGRLASLGVPVSLSSVVAAEFREYERTSTTTLNAYLAPRMAHYLANLARRADTVGLSGVIQVMRSSGGLMGIEAAARLPAAVLLSGPAGGVVATAALGNALDDDRLIAFDMGGTSTDVCRIEGGVPEVSFERRVGGHPCRMPSVAVHTVGAGGGSLGWRDPGGALRVGPRSAGANPGPACYGRGGVDPAVTDANVLLGRIAADARLAGTVPVRFDLAERALASLGVSLGMDARAVALGMLAVVEAHMERAIRTVSVEEGADPRPARLVAFGGAGGLHATALARRLEMRGVVIPPHAGVFSAVGLLLAPPRHDAARSLPVDRQDFALVERVMGEVAEIATSALVEVGEEAREVRCSADVRYRGQAHETSVSLEGITNWDDLAERFHRTHAERNGFSRPEDPIEVTTVRASALGTAVLGWDDLPEVVPMGDPARGEREVVLADGPSVARILWRPGLAAGDVVEGPAVIEETQATTLLRRGERAVVHGTGALEVNW